MNIAAAALGMTLAAALPTAAAEMPISTCMNLSNALEAPAEGDWGYRITKDDIDRIAQAGYDAIRIPIRWSAHAGATPPYTIDPAFLARVDTVAQTVVDAGLQAIINVHHYRQIMADPAAHRPRLRRIWEQLSAHYADWPDALIFEVLNEASGNLDAETTDQINANALSIIRRNNPDRWVILGTAEWGSLWGMLAGHPPQDDRLIASFHYYDPFPFTHQGAAFVDPPLPTGVTWGTAGDHAQLAAHLDQAAAYGAAHDLPVFLGEFGVYREVPEAARADWISAVRNGAEARGIGWCHWGFAAEFRAYEPSDARWIDAISTALGKP